MKVILIMVSSVDGKTTKWDNPHVYEWTSKEDQEHFHKLIESNTLIVMGRETYEAVRPKPQKGKLRLVLTRRPAKYQSLTIKGQLEFTNESPKVLVARLSREKFKQMLLVGGSVINTLFLRAGLVDELWLTIEPKIFGKGKMLVSEEELDIGLKLLAVQKLNLQGPLLLKYQIDKNKSEL